MSSHSGLIPTQLVPPSLPPVLGPDLATPTVSYSSTNNTNLNSLNLNANSNFNRAASVSIGRSKRTVPIISNWTSRASVLIKSAAKSMNGHNIILPPPAPVPAPVTAVTSTQTSPESHFVGSQGSYTGTYGTCSISSNCFQRKNLALPPGLTLGLAEEPRRGQEEDDVNTTNKLIILDSESSDKFVTSNTNSIVVERDLLTPTALMKSLAVKPSLPLVSRIVKKVGDIVKSTTSTSNSTSSMDHNNYINTNLNIAGQIGEVLLTDHATESSHSESDDSSSDRVIKLTAFALLKAVIGEDLNASSNTTTVTSNLNNWHNSGELRLIESSESSVNSVNTVCKFVKAGSDISSGTPQTIAGTSETSPTIGGSGPASGPSSRAHSQTPKKNFFVTGPGSSSESDSSDSEKDGNAALALVSNLIDNFSSESSNSNQKLLEQTVSLIYSCLKNRMNQIQISADNTTNSKNEIAGLERLGALLGRLTLARNKNLKGRQFDLKTVLVDAYVGGRLRVVVPVACRILESSGQSKVVISITQS